MARIKMHIPKAKLPFYPPCEVKCRLQNGVSTFSFFLLLGSVSIVLPFFFLLLSLCSSFWVFFFFHFFLLFFLLLSLGSGFWVSFFLSFFFFFFFLVLHHRIFWSEVALHDRVRMGLDLDLGFQNTHSLNTVVGVSA